MILTRTMDRCAFNLVNVSVSWLINVLQAQERDDTSMSSGYTKTLKVYSTIAPGDRDEAELHAKERWDDLANLAYARVLGEQGPSRRGALHTLVSGGFSPQQYQKHYLLVFLVTNPQDETNTDSESGSGSDDIRPSSHRQRSVERPVIFENITTAKPPDTHAKEKSPAEQLKDVRRSKYTAPPAAGTHSRSHDLTTHRSKRDTESKGRFIEVYEDDEPKSSSRKRGKASRQPTMDWPPVSSSTHYRRREYSDPYLPNPRSNYAYNPYPAHVPYHGRRDSTDGAYYTGYDTVDGPPGKRRHEVRGGRSETDIYDKQSHIDDVPRHFLADQEGQIYLPPEPNPFAPAYGYPPYSVPPPLIQPMKYGMTRVPKAHFRREALIEAGWPFEDEHDSFLIRRPLDREQVDRMLARSRDLEEHGKFYEMSCTVG